MKTSETFVSREYRNAIDTFTIDTIDTKDTFVWSNSRYTRRCIQFKGVWRFGSIELNWVESFRNYVLENINFFAGKPSG